MTGTVDSGSEKSVPEEGPQPLPVPWNQLMEGVLCSYYDTGRSCGDQQCTWGESASCSFDGFIRRG